MPRPKGLPKTGGRQKGVPNRRTQELQAGAAESGLDPVRYLLHVMGDESAGPERRDRAAVAVAPYLVPRLAVVDSTIRTAVSVTTLSDEERREKARQLIREAFAERSAMIEHTVAGRRLQLIPPTEEQANDEPPTEREG